MRRLSSALLVTFLILGTARAAAETALLLGDPERGRGLHAAQCVGCHDDKIYTRDNRRVKSLSGLIKQVEICNRQLQAELSRAQVNDLIAYLNEAYYRFE